jgi:hypothetical protein
MFFWINKGQFRYNLIIITVNNKYFIKIKQDNSTERIIIDEVIQRAYYIAGRATTYWKAYREGYPEIPLLLKSYSSIRNTIKKANYNKKQLVKALLI